MSTNEDDHVDQIRRLFEERFTHFIDSGPGHYSVRKVIKPLETHYFTCASEDTFVPCAKHSFDLHQLYLNGATLSFAIKLASEDGSRFTEESVVRAHKLKDLYIASPSFEDVKFHLLNGTPDFETLKLKSEGLHERFIREMAIEFNQVVDADYYVEAYRSKERTMEEIVEALKSEYYSTWRNKKDFEWIATLTDYTDEYIIDEYAKLDR
jgi:hypothetical protein